MSVQVAEILALNAELAALVRSGIAVEFGLRALANEPAHRLSALAQRVVERLETGRTLEEAVAPESDPLSAIYATTLATAIRSGRPADVLERFVAMDRLGSRVRRDLWVALAYPFLVASLTVVMMAVALNLRSSLWASTAAVFRLPESGWVAALEATRTVLMVHWWWLPVAGLLAVRVLLGSGLWWLDPRTRGWGRSPWRQSLWIPGVAKVAVNLDAAQVTHLLSVLVAQQVPWPEALRLVARTAQQATLANGLKRLAEAAAQGQDFPGADRRSATAAECGGLPAFFVDEVRAGLARGHLAAHLRGVAEIFERRALRQAQWLRLLVPSLATAVIAGGTVLFFALLIFGSLNWLWLGLALEPVR